MECTFQAELRITNLNSNHKSERHKDLEVEEPSSSGDSEQGDVSSNEEIEDY